MISMILRKNKSQNGIAFHKSGKGDPIILIHGLGLSAECWYKQISFLKKDYTVYALDLPGHGKSDLLSQAKPQLKNYSNKIINFIKDKKIIKPILIGHSLGALITIQIAGQSPKLLKSGIAVSPIFNRSKLALKKVQVRAKELELNTDKKNIAKEPLKRWFGSSKTKIAIDNYKFVERLIKNNKRSFNYKGYSIGYKTFSEIKGNTNEVIKKIKCPMMFITGEKDQNSSPLMSKKLARFHNSKVLIIKNARHALFLTHFNQFNFHLNQFIKGLEY